MSMSLLLLLISSGYSFTINSKNVKRHHTLVQRHNNNDSNELDKGFNLLETASNIIPQGTIVSTAKTGWKFVWSRMMAELAPQDKSGSYTRSSSSFTNNIGDVNFPDEGGRYHLYVGNPCPWCHRALLSIKLRDISPDEVGITQLLSNAEKATRGGWIFESSIPKHKEPVYNSVDLYSLYSKLEPTYKGRCTAPLLVDKRSKKIVSNESSDIIRMLNSASFGSTIKERRDIYPQELKKDIDAACSWIYEMINNGVYQCGFSTTQSAYNNASAKVRLGLEKCNTILSTQNYICSPTHFTEADLYLLPTILRFDGVYSPLFRAGGVHLRIATNYPAIHTWLQRCWDINDGCIRDTIDVEEAQLSYYKQLFPLNPGGLVPMGITLQDIGLKDN